MTVRRFQPAWRSSRNEHSGEPGAVQPGASREGCGGGLIVPPRWEILASAINGRGRGEGGKNRRTAFLVGAVARLVLVSAPAPDWLLGRQGGLGRAPARSLRPN
jgi:hypothetical protein